MADYIRMDELRVSCNIPMDQILSLSIHEGIGIHTKAEVSSHHPGWKRGYNL